MRKNNHMDFVCHIFKTISRKNYNLIAAAESAARNLPADIAKFTYSETVAFKNTVVIWNAARERAFACKRPKKLLHQYVNASRSLLDFLLIAV